MYNWGIFSPVFLQTDEFLSFGAQTKRVNVATSDNNDQYFRKWQTILRIAIDYWTNDTAQLPRFLTLTESLGHTK